MHVIGHQAPCIQSRPTIWDQAVEALDEVATVALIAKDASSFYPACNDMMNDPARIQARTRCHDSAKWAASTGAAMTPSNRCADRRPSYACYPTTS